MGRVIIAGAGPGDPELITLKTVKFLSTADVILVDRLVSESIITSYCNPEAEIIHVGKQCSLGNSTPQSTINELLVYYALQGKTVVRLKGGDVSIFSNILDELQALSENNISYEIIPGITAASGAAAHAGIPLTARGLATSVRFLTFYKASILTNEYWNDLANTEDTLVFYMSSGTLPRIVKNLTERNINKDKLLAIVEQATTPNQKVHTCSLYDYENKYNGKEFISPSLIIVGRVVSLHGEYAWRINSESKQNYFKPVELSEIKLTA